MSNNVRREHLVDKKFLQEWRFNFLRGRDRENDFFSYHLTVCLLMDFTLINLDFKSVV